METQQERPNQQGITGRYLLIAGFVVLCAIALTIFVARSASRPNLDGGSGASLRHEASIAAGKQLYDTRCASCHGTSLEGALGWPQRQANGVMPASPLDLGSPAQGHDDAWLFRTIKEGGQATAPAGYTSYMPAMGSGLSNEQIWVVIAYIKSTWTR